jgi:hypothetical protein
LPHTIGANRSTEENHPATDNPLRIGKTRSAKLSIGQKVAMSPSDFSSTIAVNDELTAGALWKSERCAIVCRHRIVSHHRFCKMPVIDTAYNVAGVETQPQ